MRNNLRHTISAVFAGSASFDASTSAAVTQTVSKADTTTTLTSSGPAMLGDSVTFTAIVGPVAPGAGTPTGMLTFTDGATVIGAAALAHGTAVFSTDALTIGTHSISAAYAGDGSFNSSQSSALAQTVTYRICVLYDSAKAKMSGSTLPVKVQLCDAAGVTTSSTDRVVTATRISVVTGGPAGPLAASGNANPGNVFRLDAGTYIFNLKTTGFSTGTYALWFTVSGDPIEHDVPFTVR